MTQVVAEIHVMPVGTPTASISDYVSRCELVLKEFRSVQYRINPLSTTLEGEAEEIWQVVRRMHEACFEEGVQRVVTSVRLDERRDRPSDMAHRIEVVRQKAGLGA